ncbi:MAG: KamA family radical SAM protein [Candidatus Latescibacteria bacterium]|nr:KamA family radical SAM protein [Candidatus Latescibacterota bacterium]NIO57280.1 KamA family radical SAM protein [Candidatus Latescibacterota bacterium]
MPRRVSKKHHTFSLELLKEVAGEVFRVLSRARTVNVARERLINMVSTWQLDISQRQIVEGHVVRIRDCARALRSILSYHAEELSGFSVMGALYDIAHNKPDPELKEGFFAEMIHLFLGVQGKAKVLAPGDYLISDKLSGRDAAIARSRELDKLWENVDRFLHRYPHGLMEETIARRIANRQKILSVLSAKDEDWYDWRWQLRNVVKDPGMLAKYIPVGRRELESLERAKAFNLAFGVTPYYLSLMDQKQKGRDHSVRAQVIPPKTYVQRMREGKLRQECSLDFMLEIDTSPIDLVTRRYPGIVILKPYNTCPQICVYCQRNWEIQGVLADDALAPRKKIREAVEWIRAHPAIREVLITGGDPMAMHDEDLQWVLEEVASVPTVERIRIGTRTLVTMPMRFTPEVVSFLESLHVPLKRDICVVTHVQHPYEVTLEMHQAVDRLRNARIPIYNQNVFTFYVSRRFEASCLRILLKRIGIDPYYTFNTKGKEETAEYRVPIARLLQEQKEEARLLPGLVRTDETVYNVPGLGKNYLRAIQHRQLLSILPDGSRVYEFHPWEKNIAGQKTYVSVDVPILDYLRRLKEFGEDVDDYETIWYYF